MISNHNRFGLPLLLFPGISITITLLPMYDFFIYSQYMPIPLQPTFLEISPIFLVPLIISFLILSSLVTPLIHLNILIPATSNFNKIFNKIAIQRTTQMAVDKEAIICLSRVYSYSFKCNFPLFYVYPALTRYLSILFLNILTLLACTHASDNLFHTLKVLCENENFLTSNLLCFFTRVKLCPLVILLSLISKKKRLESIFS